jgi:hypothetical protein
MRFIETKKRKLIALFVIVVLLALAFFPVMDELRGRDTAESIEVLPLEVSGGAVNEFSIKTESAGGVVMLPESVLPIFDDKVSDERNLTFEGRTFVFSAIVPPTAESINITVKSGDSTEKFPVSVVQNEDPLVSGENIVNRMEHVTDPSNGMMRRVTSHPQLEVGARYFRDEFRGFGLDADIVRYWNPTGPNIRQMVLGVFIWNVVAYHWGADRNEWIVIGGHYDVAPGTLEGAYDNTGGSSSVVEVARGISQFETDKTIVFALWAGEEEGLWGAKKFTENVPAGVTIKTYINLDMAGLNYPAPFDLAAIVGPDEDPEISEQAPLISITNRSAHDILDYPRVSGVNVTENPFGRSDHVRFQQIGVSTVFFFGAGDNDEYPAYHTTDDTMDEMERVAGGRENLIGGFDTLVWTVFYMVLLLDNDDVITQKR